MMVIFNAMGIPLKPGQVNLQSMSSNDNPYPYTPYTRKHKMDRHSNQPDESYRFTHQRKLSKKASFQRRFAPLISVLIIALSTITCSLGSGSSTEPFFTPPGGGNNHALLPEPTAITTETPSLIGSGVGVPGLDELPSIDESISSDEFDPKLDPDPSIDTVSTPTPDRPPSDSPPILYYTQAGDSLPVVATRFDVHISEISSPEPIPEKAFFPPDQLLIIPHRLANTTTDQRLLPDSEVVFSPSAVDFDIHAFVAEAGGYLSSYNEFLKTSGNTSGAGIVYRVAIENSINPRLLLAILEHRSGWVYGQPATQIQRDYPMGYISLSHKGLFPQLIWAVQQISTGYYGWREGILTSLSFPDGVTARMAPSLNAGSAALQYLYSKLNNTEEWISAIDTTQGLPAIHERMFGNPWIRAQNVEPLYPPGLVQPPLILPFEHNVIWGFSGGPHGAWDQVGARAALDFAPGSLESGCVESNAWVVAAAPGLVVRSGTGYLVQDLDGDGQEQTGWAILYLHLASHQRIPVGTWVEAGDKLGHPSCEGGFSTGTHIHIARKYNGEWIPADGPIPFNLDGWIAKAGDLPYEGYLIKDGVTIPASVFGVYGSRIIRVPDNP
jgi:LasA protease